VRITRKLLVPALSVALGLLAAPVNQAMASATEVSGLTSFHQLEVVGDHLFLTGAPGSGSGIIVTDLSGKRVTTLDPGADVAAMAQRGSTLYARLTSGPEANSIASIAVPAGGSTSFGQKFTSLLGGLLPSGLADVASALGLGGSGGNTGGSGGNGGGANGNGGNAGGTAASGAGGVRATGSGSAIDVYGAGGHLANVIDLGGQTLASGGLAWAGSTLIAVTKDATTGLYEIQRLVGALTGTGGGKTPAPAPSRTAQSPVSSPKAASAKASGQLPTVLSISAPNQATYDPKISVTAQLGPTLSNRTVAIYGQPAGSAKRLLKKGTVDSSGQLTVSYTAPYTTTFTAVFSGDSLNAPKTVTHTVTVLAKTSLSVTGWYGKKSENGSTYLEYHRSGNVNVDIAVAPNKSGECVWVEGQEYYNGAWQANMKSACAALNSASKLSGYLTAINSDSGYPYRIRVHYLPSSKDKRNAGAITGWQYLLPGN
jgi:hypothetical protein